MVQSTRWLNPTEAPIPSDTVDVRALIGGWGVAEAVIASSSEHAHDNHDRVADSEADNFMATSAIGSTCLRIWAYAYESRIQGPGTHVVFACLGHTSSRSSVPRREIFFLLICTLACVLPRLTTWFWDKCYTAYYRGIQRHQECAKSLHMLWHRSKIHSRKHQREAQCARPLYKRATLVEQNASWSWHPKADAAKLELNLLVLLAHKRRTHYKSKSLTWMISLQWHHLLVTLLTAPALTFSSRQCPMRMPKTPAQLTRPLI